MYRDEQDALRARLETLEAELEAERASRIAAEAHMRAHQARAHEATRQCHRSQPRPAVSPIDDIVGWWAKPWIAVAVSAMLALGVYMALRVSQEAARGARFHHGCPYRADKLRVFHAVERQQRQLESCAAKAHGQKRFNVRLTVGHNGQARAISVGGPRPLDRSAALCVQRVLKGIHFPALSQLRPVTLRFILTP